MITQAATGDRLVEQALSQYRGWERVHGRDLAPMMFLNELLQSPTADAQALGIGFAYALRRLAGSAS
jgi:hypothetical protein